MVEGPLSASTGAADSEVLRMRSLKLLLEEATCLEKSVVLSDGKALSEAGVVRPRLLGVAKDSVGCCDWNLFLDPGHDHLHEVDHRDSWRGCGGQIFCRGHPSRAC